MQAAAAHRMRVLAPLFRRSARLAFAARRLLGNSGRREGRMRSDHG